MPEVRSTEAYASWLDGLRYVGARARVLVRVERLAMGNPGDVRPVGEGVSEIAGGNKRTQSDDIDRAHRLARNL